MLSLSISKGRKNLELSSTTKDSHAFIKAIFVTLDHPGQRRSFRSNKVTFSDYLCILAVVCNILIYLVLLMVF